MDLRGYETVRRRCLYDSDVWLRTMTRMGDFAPGPFQNRPTFTEARDDLPPELELPE